MNPLPGSDESSHRSCVIPIERLCVSRILGICARLRCVKHVYAFTIYTQCIMYGKENPHQVCTNTASNSQVRAHSHTNMYVDIWVYIYIHVYDHERRADGRRTELNLMGGFGVLVPAPVGCERRTDGRVRTHSHIVGRECAQWIGIADRNKRTRWERNNCDPPLSMFATATVAICRIY